MPQNGDCVAAAVVKRVGESLNADVCGKGGNAGGTHGIYCALDQQFSYCIKGNAEGKFLVGTFINKYPPAKPGDIYFLLFCGENRASSNRVLADFIQ